MSKPHHHNLEKARRRVRLTLQIALVVLAAAGVALYTDYQRIQRVDHDLLLINRELQSFDQRYSREPLPDQIRAAEELRQQLQQEWEHLRVQVDTFGGRLPKLASLEDSEEDARIDFKVALFNARESLQTLASENGVTLTDDLGINDMIGAEESTESRLWELAAVVRLIDVLVASGVSSIDSIEPLPPLVYAEVPDENEYARVFPVRLEAQCRFKQLRPLLTALSQPGSFYVISQCDIATSPLEPDRLQLRLTCGALRFLVGPSPESAEAFAPADASESGNGSRRVGS